MRVQDDQLEHYHRELSYLRTESASFAARYPKLARRLVLTDAESANPHIQHLIESVAFLTAGVIIGSKNANLSPLFDTRREGRASRFHDLPFDTRTSNILLVVS